MASKSIKIPMKDVKETMKGWYDKYFEGEDESYSELFAALRTLRNAGMISEEEWKEIWDYDHILFQETCGIVPQ